MMRQQKGSQSIEFAMVLIPFLLLFIGFFEISRVLLVSAIFESAVSAGVREVRVLPQGLRAEQTFRDEIDQFPMLDVDNLTITATAYGVSLNDIANVVPVLKRDAILAEYQITYNYELVILPGLSDYFSDSIDDMTELNRRVLVSYDNK